MYIINHPQHDVLTLVRYDATTGFVEVKMTGLAEQTAVVTKYPLAQFLAEVGIPVPAPELVPEPTAA